MYVNFRTKNRIPFTKDGALKNEKVEVRVAQHGNGRRGSGSGSSTGSANGRKFGFKAQNAIVQFPDNFGDHNYDFSEEEILIWRYVACLSSQSHCMHVVVVVVVADSFSHAHVHVHCECQRPCPSTPWHTSTARALNAIEISVPCPNQINQ